MKITSNAFEFLYQRCDPDSRRAFFKMLAEFPPPALAAVCHVSVPVLRVEQLMSGYSHTQAKMITASDGAWDVAG